MNKFELFDLKLQELESTINEICDGAKSKNDVAVQALKNIHNYLLESVKPWDSGHSMVYDIANNALTELNEHE